MKYAFVLCSAAFFILMAAFMLYDLAWKTHPYVSEISLGDSLLTVALFLLMAIFGIVALFVKD